MKKETLKELGKYHLDISKILAGLAIVAPFMKDETVSVGSFVVVIITLTIGFTLINQGVSDEWWNYHSRVISIKHRNYCFNNQPLSRKEYKKSLKMSSLTLSALVILAFTIGAVIIVQLTDKKEHKPH